MPFIDKSKRVGNFTSSEIYRLMTVGTDRKSFGKPALTYIQEKKYEARLGRTLSLDRANKDALWGKFLESRVFELLDDTGYQLVEDRTIEHPTIPRWVGTPDLQHDRDSVVSDIKCYAPKAFCEYVDLLTEAHKDNDTEMFKAEYPQQYWQLVSNSILLNTKYIEAIVYIPYYEELQAIRESVDMLDSEDDRRKYAFIKNSSYHELSYIERGYYKNLNIFRFAVPESDKELLTTRVKQAGELLNK